MYNILIGGVAIFAGSVVQGCAGFGFSLVAAPFLLFILSPREVIPILVLISIALNLMVLKDCGRHLNFKKILPILAGGVLSLPLGIHLLTVLDPGFFKVVVGIFIVAVALIMMSGWRKPLPPSLWSLIPIGLVSGVLNGSLSMSGPPVVLFLNNQGTGKEEFRANMAGYFFSLNLFTVAIYMLKGVLNVEVLTTTAIYVPVFLIGTWIGIKISHVIPEGLFKKVTLTLITLTGIVMVMSNI